MKRLAFVLYKYFPYGGLQRDCLAIARACRERGAVVTLYAMQWDGPRPADLHTEVLPAWGLTNPARYRRFHSRVGEALADAAIDAVVGFNRMPGLDWYYAADACFRERALAERPFWYRWTPRFRHFEAMERAVFGRSAKTQVLLLTPAAQAAYRKHYATETPRFHVLPPGIARDRMADDQAAVRRARVRAEFGITHDERMVLLLGSGFRTKGLDRAIRALAALPAVQRRRTHLLAIGNDRAWPFERLARRLGVDERVRILPGRDDVPDLLQAADLLLHPAYAENTGTVLVEAIIAGLPVLCTDVCGYAHHVVDAEAGQLIASPFAQARMNAQLQAMLDAPEPERAHWRAAGIRYGRTRDLYDAAARAAEVILR